MPPRDVGRHARRTPTPSDPCAPRRSWRAELRTRRASSPRACFDLLTPVLDRTRLNSNPPKSWFLKLSLDFTSDGSIEFCFKFFCKDLREQPAEVAHDVEPADLPRGGYMAVTWRLHGDGYTAVAHDVEPADNLAKGGGGWRQPPSQAFASRVRRVGTSRPSSRSIRFGSIRFDRATIARAATTASTRRAARRSRSVGRAARRLPCNPTATATASPSGSPRHE